MAFVVADRVRETGSASGTGSVFLVGPTDGFASFVSGIGHGNDTFYAILDPNTGDYEVGVGEIRSAAQTAFADDHIVRNGDVYTSSNSDALVNFTSGNSLVCICTQPSSKAVFVNAADETAVGATLDLDTSVLTDHATYKEGRIFYDPIHKTLNYYSDISNVEHEIGLEEHHRVYNNTGATILKGQPLYFSGNYSNEMPTVGLADATDVARYNAQGLAAADIPNNSEGYILTSGLIDDVDTSGLFAGTNFFVGLTPGAVQNQSPTYPNYPMCLGWVVKSDATTGVLLVNQQNHSVNSFRVRTDTHIGGDLIIDGDLTVVGSQTIASSANIETGAPFLYLNSGDTIGEANTTFTGSGLDDAYFDGHYSGTATATYYVKIDSTSGTKDTFSWSKDNFSTTEATGVIIDTAGNSLDNGISVLFATNTGHTLNDVWSGTAAPTNVDTGLWSNINTGTTGVGYTHVGMFYDVTDNKFKFVDEYDLEPTGTINTNHNSYSAGDLVVNDIASATANVSGNISVGGTVDGRDIAADGTKLDGIATNANNYSLPLSESSIRGGIKVGYTENGKNYPVELSSEQAYVNVPWTDTDTTYSTATSSTAGLVKIGYTASGKNYPVQLSNDQMYVNVPWTDTDTNTTYSAATSSALGLIKIGYTASGKNYPVVLDANSKAYVNVPWIDTDTNTTYSQANSTTLGLIKVGYTETGKNYPVELNGSGQAFVNVPWVDTNTDTNTTYSAGTGLSLSGTTFNANVSATSQTTGANSLTSTTSRTYAVQVDGSDNLVVNVPWVDTNTDTNTTYSAGSGLSLSGTTFSNSAPDQTVSLTGSGATSVSGTYPNFTISSTDTNTNTTYSAGTGLSLSGTTFSLASNANADTVDSLHASSFIRSDATDSVTGYTRWNDGYGARFGNGDDLTIYHHSTNFSSYIDNKTNHLYIRNNVDNDDGGNIYLQAKAGENGIIVNDDSYVQLYHNGNERLRTVSGGIEIMSGGIYINDNIYHRGDTNTWMGFHATDQWRVVTAGSERLEITTTAITAALPITSSGDITAFSDIRLKENVETIDNALDKVKSMRGVTYTKDGKDGLGVIAQEIEEVIPQVVLTADDEIGTKSVAYGNIVGLLIEAVKEQQQQIDDLKNEITALKGYD